MRVRALGSRYLWLVPLSLVLAINGAVRLCGGDPHWLSLRHLPEKSAALARLGLHLIGDVGAGHELPMERIVVGAARTHGVSTRLSLSLARVESSLNPHAISRTGAMGLMQLMPRTARERGVRDPFDPAQNADAGVRYLRGLLIRYEGDARRALWAYNAGSARVPRRGPARVPRETGVYAERVLRAGM